MNILILFKGQNSTIKIIDMKLNPKSSHKVELRQYSIKAIEKTTNPFG